MVLSRFFMCFPSVYIYIHTYIYIYIKIFRFPMVFVRKFVSWSKPYCARYDRGDEVQKPGTPWSETRENSHETIAGWWWLEHDFYFSIYWEWSSQLTNIFQRGWNHQPEHVLKRFSLLYDPIPPIWNTPISWLQWCGISLEKTMISKGVFNLVGGLEHFLFFH